MIAETVRRFHAEATLSNPLTGMTADGRSVLAMISLDVQRGHVVVLEANGDDENELIDAVGVLVHERFGEHPEQQNAQSMPMQVGVLVAELPAALSGLGLTVIAGAPVSAGPWGSAWAGGDTGAVVAVGELALDEDDLRCRSASASVEREHFERGVRTVRQSLRARREAVRQQGGGVAEEIIGAHLSIVDDPVLTTRVLALIDEGAPAPCAVILAGRGLADTLRGSSSAYVRDRVGDVEEVCRELVRGIEPQLCPAGAPKLSEPSVVVASMIGVGDVLGLDREMVAGLIVGRVGETSHVAILARAMQLPTIACDSDPVRLIRAAGGARTAIVDAIGGYAVLDPGRKVTEYVRREREARRQLSASQRPLLQEPGRTGDGQRMDVGGNTATAAETRAAIACGADGIGLYRTEMLFLDRAHPPSEEEQFQEYAHAAREVRDGQSVIFRTFDIGADKPAPYLSLPRENNPFLGVRGFRVYDRHPDLIRAQVRAICRASGVASAQGQRSRVWIMAPMVATIEEARRFADLVRDAQRMLADEGAAFDPDMPIGVMVEVPSLAAVVGRLEGIVRFVSIGTNDLTQYLFAADRTSASVGTLNRARQPELIGVLARVIAEAKAAGLWVGVCGELAADAANLPLLVGMGADEISVNPGAIGELKSQIRRLTAATCTDVTRQAALAHSVAEVDGLLARLPRAIREADPILESTILLDGMLASRHAVIHALACTVAGAGRASDPRRLESDVWTREREGNTGVGFGVAIPHAKSVVVHAPTIAMVRLAEPVRWADSAEAEAEEVTLAVMLCVPAGLGRDGGVMDAAHQRMLAALARRLMHEDFREQLRGAQDAATVAAILRSNLNMPGL